jgi:hypothetical protein
MKSKKPPVDRALKKCIGRGPRFFDVVLFGMNNPLSPPAAPSLPASYSFFSLSSRYSLPKQADGRQGPTD